MRALADVFPARTSLRAHPWLIAAWVLLAASLILRAGEFPAAMTGDEIWFGESAWQFLQHGIPFRAIHADAVGSAVADFLPPTIMLAQAFAFALLGLSQSAVGALGVVVPLAVSSLVYLLARRGGAGFAWAALAGMAVLGSQSFLRAGLYIRYEGLVALCFLGYLLAGATMIKAQHRLGRDALRGLLLALAGLSYYPTAPFIAVAALLVEAALWRARPPSSAALFAFLGGALVPILPFALYVARYPAIFAAQVLDNGTANYFTFELLREPLRMLRLSRDAIPETVALVGFTGLACWRWRRLSGPSRLLIALIGVTMLPALIFPFQPRLLALPILLALVVGARLVEEEPALLGRIARFGLPAGAAAAMAAALLMTATALMQRDARDYDHVVARLEALMPLPGPAAIDQRAWLALRMAQPERELHQVFAFWAPERARIFESEILRDSAGARHFRYVVLNAEDWFETVLKVPALTRAFSDGGMVEVGRVSAEFRPLPWAASPPYELIVFANPVVARASPATAPTATP